MPTLEKGQVRVNEVIDMLTFKDYHYLEEELHPELQKLVKAPTTLKEMSKQGKISKKIRQLHEAGEETGIEGNMPKGSSRAYLRHKDELPVNIDGKQTKIKTGIKIAIRNDLDKHLDSERFKQPSLGHLQNFHENANDNVNEHFRVLTKDDKGIYHHNPEGIFPPLIDYDHSGHEWAHVGHADTINDKQFKKLTRTESHPEGIEHKDFMGVLDRDHERKRGKYWEGSDEEEKHLDYVETHPLVQNFLTHQRTHNIPPGDYRDIKNMGVFRHDDKEHVVSRDHGYSNEVYNAFNQALHRSIGSR